MDGDGAYLMRINEAVDVIYYCTDYSIIGKNTQQLNSIKITRSLILKVLNISWLIEHTNTHHFTIQTIYIAMYFYYMDGTVNLCLKHIRIIESFCIITMYNDNYVMHLREIQIKYFICICRVSHKWFFSINTDVIPRSRLRNIATDLIFNSTKRWKLC